MNRAFCAALVLIGFAGPIAPRRAAADATAGTARVPDGLIRFRTFGAAEGLSNLAITSITQDASGSLWVGTEDGVFRYDGERFTRFGAEQGVVPVATLVVGTGPDGNVCAGGSDGLACWDGAQFSRAETSGLPEVAVYAIATVEHRMWVGTANGLYVGDGRRGFARAEGWPGSGPVKAVWADARGVVAADGGRVWISAGDRVWRELSDAGLSGRRVEGVVRDRAGALWIRTARELWRLPDGAARAEDRTAGAPPISERTLPGNMVLGHDGELWLAGQGGIAYETSEGLRLAGPDRGAPFGNARTLLVDRDGTIWVGAGGLFQSRGRGLIERYDRSNGLPGDTAWSIARDRDGTLWVGTSQCLARMIHGNWECLAGTEKRAVRSFVFPPQGGVFVGGVPAELLYIDPAGTVMTIGRELARTNDQGILALQIGTEGDLWIGTRAGLFRMRGLVPGAIERVEVPGIPADASFPSLLVADDRLWAASTSGTAILEHGRWRVLGAADGLRASAMRYVLHMHDHEYCVTYDDPIGMSCFEMTQAVSNIRHIGVAEGLGIGAVYFLGVDRRRRLWIGTGDGVDVLAGDAVEHFNDSDGLAGNDASATAFFEDTDGSLWLGATGGLSHVFAERYDGPPPPPHVVVRGGSLGLQVLHDRSLGDLETTYDRNALRVELGSDRLEGAARIEYQVRLMPLEPEWTATMARQARYPALLPGSYRLEARARLRAGAWGPVTTLPFVVRAAWWQTGWFLALECIAALVVIAVGFNWRQRAVLARRTRQLNEESTAKLRELLEYVPDLISVHRDGHVIYANLAARRLYGILADTKIAGLGDRIHPEDAAAVEKMMHPPQDGGPRGAPTTVELRVRDDDGGWRVCEVSGVWMELAGATVLVASGRDMTEGHRLRAQLLVSDRMASLGTLAAGIAHEINNPLSYVLGNLQIMAESFTAQSASPAEFSATIADATDGAQRVAKIVQGLRSFSRAEEEVRVRLDVPEVVGVAIRLTANEVKHRAQLVCEFGAIPKVVADNGRLAQVFINLIANAAHAIPEGHSDANRIVVRTRTDEAGQAVIEIEDTGRGMPPEVIARAFDPFFTTKSVGDGTGLGLSICHGIISALGGRIAIESAVGKGTVIRVVIPPAPAPEVASASAAMASGPAGAPRRRVLVVDDEPLVVEMLARALRRDHDVHTALCGREALELIRGGAGFDAIVSDVMMPNMTGIELLEALMAHDPAQGRRLLFLSGGVFTPESRARLDELGTLQLEKPVDTKVLRAAVARVAGAVDGAVHGDGSAMSRTG